MRAVYVLGIRIGVFFAVLFVQDGLSPVYAASHEGHTDVVDLLVQAGADIHLAETEVHVSTHSVLFSEVSLSE